MYVIHNTENGEFSLSPQGTFSADDKLVFLLSQKI